MATAINLGPLDLRNPSSSEATEIRENLRIGTAGILNAAFTTVGADVRLRLSDPVNPAYSVELSATRLFDTRANRLITPRKIYIEDRTIQNFTSVTQTNILGSAFSRTGNTVTVNLTAHGYSTGDFIEIDGLNEIEFRGRYSITRQTADRFTYTTSTSSNIASATGTATLTKELPTGSATFVPSDIYTPSPYAEFDGTRDHIIVGKIRPSVVLRRHIADWDPTLDRFTNTTTGTSTGITTEKIQNGAITPAKLSPNGPSWDPADGDTTISGSLEVSGGTLILDSAYTIETQSVTGSKFVMTSGVVNVNHNGHGYESGDVITVSDLPETLFYGTYSITRIDSNNYRYTVPGTSVSLTGTGTAKVRKRKFAEDGGGRIVLSGRGINTLSSYNSSKSWQIISRDNETSTTTSGDFEIQGEITAKILDKLTQTSRSVDHSKFTKVNATTINVEHPAHGFATNDIVTISGLTHLSGSTPDYTILLNGTFEVTRYNANNFRYTIPSPGITGASLNIQGTATATLINLDGNTGIGMRIDRTEDLVLMPKLSCYDAINASKFTPNVPVASNGTNNDFEGTAKSARVWTQPRTFDTNAIGTHVKFSFDRVNGSQNQSVAATIQYNVIHGGTNTSNSMIQEETIETFNIKDDAVTSDKLADNITITDTLTVQQASNSTALRGIVFGVNSTDTDNARIYYGTGGNLRFTAKEGYRFDTTTSEVSIDKATGNTSIPGTLAVSGVISSKSDIKAEGDVIAYSASDVRLKNSIKNIQSPLEKVSKLNGVSFVWNSLQDTYNGYDLGVIAQEVEDVFPEIVTTRENGYKAVRYEKLIPLLIECVKELKAQNEELNSRIEQLSN